MKTIGILREFDSILANERVPITRRRPIAFNLRTNVSESMAARLSEVRLMKSDAHVHTTYSDGLLSPEQVFRRAADNNVGAVVLVDHNSIGDVFEDMETARNIGVDYTFAGVELSMFFRGNELHMKTYFDPFRAETFLPIVSRMAEGVVAVSAEKVKILKELAVSDFKEATHISSWSKMTDDLSGAGISKEDAVRILKTILQRFRKAPEERLDLIIKASASKKALAEAVNDTGIEVIRGGADGKTEEQVFYSFCNCVLPELLERSGYSTPHFSKVLRELAELGGWNVMGHPGRAENSEMGREEISKLIEELAALELIKGVETKYGGHNKATESYYSALCRKLGLIEDGGSDFHNTNFTSTNYDIGTGLLGDLDLDYSMFESVRKFLTAPLYRQAGEALDQAVDHGDTGCFWDALAVMRRISIIDPYDLRGYSMMADTLERIK